LVSFFGYHGERAGYTDFLRQKMAYPKKRCERRSIPIIIEANNCTNVWHNHLFYGKLVSSSVYEAI